MKELLVLLSPIFWALRNDIVRFRGPFYKKALLYLTSGSLFIILITKLLTVGMLRLQSMSQDIFSLILMKGFSLIFLIIFLVQIINGLIISLNSCYQSKDLDLLLTSPVSRASLFYAKLAETHFRTSWMLIVFCVPLLASSGLIYKAGISYYIYALLLLSLFSVIPVNMGVILTIFIARFISVRKLKKSLVSIGIISAVVLMTMLRLFRPERFVNPEFFANLTLFISEIRTPSFILLPNRWLSESLFAVLTKNTGLDTIVFILLLFLTAYLSAISAQILFSRFYYLGWELLQEGDIRKKKPAETSGLKIWAGMKTAKNALMQKDLLYFMRDSGNLHQSLITLSLIIIYIFSIASLPLNWEDFAVKLKYITAFFNLGLILIIIASICSRFIYPFIVSEASSLWLIKTSPVSPGQYIFTKFLFFFLPILLAGELLTTVSFIFIGTEKLFTFFMIMTTLLLSLSLVSLSVRFGLRDIKKALNNSQTQKQTGSAMHMIASVALILVTLGLETVPTFLYFLKASKQVEFAGRGWILLGGVAAVLLTLHIAVTYISMRMSIRELEMIELN